MPQKNKYRNAGMNSESSGRKVFFVIFFTFFQYCVRDFCRAAVRPS